MLQTDPQDIYCDPNTLDIVIKDGDAGLSNGLPGVAQACKIACSLIQGEWFLNLDTGIPYFQRDGVDPATVILGQPFNQTRICAPFRAALSAVPGVGSVDALTASFDPTTRTATISWSVTCVFGGTISDSLSVGF